jgi:hypothetical protein
MRVATPGAPKSSSAVQAPAPTAGSGATAAGTTAPSGAPEKAPVAPPPPEIKVVRGHYIRSGDSSIFRPCGDKVYHRIVGRGEPIYLLQQRYRFTTPFFGRPLFGIFRGYLEPDTGRGALPKPPGAPATPTTVVPMRFYLTKLDSLRPVGPTDCPR